MVYLQCAVALPPNGRGTISLYYSFPTLAGPHQGPSAGLCRASVQGLCAVGITSGGYYDTRRQTLGPNYQNKRGSLHQDPTPVTRA